MHRIKKKRRKQHINYENIPNPNKWQYQTFIKVSFSNQKLQNDIVTPRM